MTNGSSAARSIGVLALVMVCLGGPLAGAATGVQAGAGNEALTPIEDIQRNSVDGSPYAGQTVTTVGTVTAVTENGYHIQNGTGAYSGVFVYTGDTPDLTVGQRREVTGPVTEYNGLTEIDLTAEGADTAFVRDEPVPEPTVLDTGNASQEAYEGVLVTVRDATVTKTPGQYGEWAVDDGTGGLAVDDRTAGDDTTPSETGATVGALTGPLYYSFGAFKLQPTAVENLRAPGAGSGDGGTDTDGNTTTVTVLSYNDIQTAAAKDGNLSRLATLVARQRATDGPAPVVVGGGDELGPHALSAVSQWRPPVDVLNAIDPDADVVQNHELDYGIAGLSNATAAAEFPWLAANVVDESTGEPFAGTESYEIVERGGARIGIIGVADSAVFGKTAIDPAEAGVRVENYTEVGPRLAERLKDEANVDAVVALAPVGIDDSKTLARADDGAIDVIVSGDDERVYPPQPTSDTIITEAGARAAYLGALNLTVNTTTDEVTAWNGRLIEVTSDVPRNDTVSGIVRDYRSEQRLDTVVTRTTVPLDATFGSNYHRETNYGNLVTDAMRAETGADVAITNAGGIRSDSVYGPGALTGGDVFNTLPFPNTVTTVELSGRELRSTLASQVVTLGSETGQQYGAEISQQVGGVRFEWVPHENRSATIRDVWVNRAGPDERPDWEPLDPNATYAVAVNSFMAEGGSGYPLADAPRLVESDTLLAQAVIDCVAPKDTVAPTVDGRMRRVTTTVGTATAPLDGNGSVTVTADAPDSATALAADSVRVRNETGATVTATTASLAGDRLRATFDEGALGRLRTADGDLDLYANYTDSRYADQWVYWSSAVLAAEVNATGAAPEPSPGDGTATISVESLSVPRGDEGTVNVTLSAPNGFSGAALNVSARDRSVATLSLAAYGDSLSLTEQDEPDAPGVFLRTADIDGAIQPGATDVTVATLDVQAVGTGATNLTVSVDRFDAENGSTPPLATDSGRVVVGPPALGTGPGGRPPTDPDGDGRYEDVNGNGRLDYDDVTTLFEAFDAPAVQDHPTVYDFNGNGQLDYDDVVTLYAAT